MISGVLIEQHPDEQCCHLFEMRRQKLLLIFKAQFSPPPGRLSSTSTQPSPSRQLRKSLPHHSSFQEYVLNSPGLCSSQVRVPPPVLSTSSNACDRALAVASAPHTSAAWWIKYDSLQQMLWSCSLELSAAKNILPPTGLNVRILQFILQLGILKSPLPKAFENCVPFQNLKDRHLTSIIYSMIIQYYPFSLDIQFLFFPTIKYYLKMQPHFLFY